jgi:hypothetical protein
VVLVDDRVGSRHLAAMIRGAELTRLDSGDAAFTAADGRLVGIECKRVSDALQCMMTGRLADMQLPKMQQQYDIRYLLIEGRYRPDPDNGLLQLWWQPREERDWGRWTDALAGSRRMMYGSFEMWLHTMSEKGQARLERVPDKETTAALIKALYDWWQREEHQSFNVLHYGEGNGAQLSRPTMLRRMLALVPHVGWERSAILQRGVGGIQFLRRRDGQPMQQEDWYIERQIAEKSAKDIMEALSGEGD